MTDFIFNLIGISVLTFVIYGFCWAIKTIINSIKEVYGDNN